MRDERIDFQWIALAAVVFLLAPTGPAHAVPVPCPVEQGASSCGVSAGDSAVVVRASSLNGGELAVSVGAAGIVQLPLHAFTIYSFDEDEYIDVVLDSATEDDATGTIRVQFTEAFSSAIRATAVFTLSDLGDTTIIDESFTFLSLLPSGFFADGRFYVVTDYDLDNDFVNDSVIASAGGLTITQTEGTTTAVQQVTGPAPNGFDVALFPDLSGPILQGDTLVTLAGRTTAAGPDDFQHALSWDRNLGSGQSFTATLQQTITTVPEPAHALAVALATIAAVRRRRDRRGSRMTG
jgi:hypothetical protein